MRQNLSPAEYRQLQEAAATLLREKVTDAIRTQTVAELQTAAHEDESVQQEATRRYFAQHWALDRLDGLLEAIADGTERND